MMRLGTAALALLLAGCDGTAGEPDGGNMMRADAGLFDAGPPVIAYTQFTLRTTGWPSGARVLGAAVLDNALFVASDQGVVALPVTETRWINITTPLTGDVKPTSLVKIDQSLVLTAAGASSGGVYVRSFDSTDWTAVTSPPNPTWSIVKKGSEFLLSTTGGLYASAAVTGPWLRRSPVNTPLFAAPIGRFVAAPAQAKIFASGVAGPLFESIDNGAMWTPSAPRGACEALAATGSFVLISSAMDGQQRSDNYGNTFRPQATPISDGVLFYAAEGTKFWAGGNGGLKSSDDNGVTFTDNNDGLPVGTPIRALFFAGSYVIADTPNGPYVNQVE